MKKMFLKAGAVVLAISMLSTMQIAPQAVVSASDNTKPDLDTIAKLDKIDQENMTAAPQSPQYNNENEYIVVKRKGVTAQDFVNKMKRAAPKAKIKERSLREEAVGITEKFKKQKQSIAKKNVYKKKNGNHPTAKSTSKAAEAVSQPTTTMTDPGLVTGTPSPIETSAQEENTPDPEITATETVAATAKKDPSVNMKEGFLIEAEKSEIDAIKEMEDVVCVEQNIRVSAFGTNYIPWGVKAVGGDYAHSRNVKGSGVKVAVIDSGILQHPDLSIAGGYNFIDNNDDYTDNQGHGTFVAGIINAQLDKMGITGIAPSADLYALKVVDDGLTGSLSDVIQGIYWCIENDMNIINMSFGTENDSQALRLAVKDAKNAGILMVASSGNGTEEITYPAKYDEVIAVGAIDNNYKAADFSAKGDKLEFVAPGADIYSTDRENTYSAKSGTSYSAAHVTGIAAGILSIDTSKSSAFVRTLMKESARNLGAKKEYGYGMPDLRQAIDIYDEFTGNFQDEKLDKDWTKPVFDYSKVKAEDDKIKLFDESSIWFEEARTVKSSPVPLLNNTNKAYTVSKNGARQIKVHFKYIDTEANYDFVSTNTSSSYSGYRTGDVSNPTNPNAVNPDIPSNTIQVTVKTDGSVQSNGFEIDKIYYEPNDIPTAPFMVTAKEDPDKTGNVLLTWRASYDSDGISRYEVYEVDNGRELKVQSGFKQAGNNVSCSVTPSNQNNGSCKFIVMAYDKYGNYSEDSKYVDYDRFDPYVARVIVQQPMPVGTPKVIAKYDNGTYTTASPNVNADTKCEVIVDYYDAANAFVKVNEEDIYRNWTNYTGQENTLNRVYTVPYTFTAKGSNKVKVELINPKGKLISKTLNINVTDTTEAPGIPTISRLGNEEYFYGQDGVNPATGNYCLSNADMELKYPTMNESIVRTYNSKKTASGGFGRGWTMSLESRIVQWGSTQYRIYYGNGSEDAFIQSGNKYVSYNTHQLLETGTLTIGGVSTAYRVIEPTGNTYCYNANGYMVLIKQKYGDVYKISLDGSNRPVKLTGPSGRYADITYNSDGLIPMISDDTGRTVYYYYNNKKQLVSSVSGAGRTTYYSYDSNGFLSQALQQKESWNSSDMIQLRGDTVTYNSDYKVSAIKNADDLTYSYLYNAAYSSNDTGYTRISRYTEQEYDGSINSLYEYYQYNSKLNLIQYINELGERTYYDVNSYGDVTKVFDRLGNESYTEYDSNGNVIKTIEPQGSTRYFKYDSNNNIICESPVDLNNTVETTGYDNTKWYYYDSKGRLIKIAEPKGNQRAFDNNNNSDTYKNNFTITTYQYQDEVAVSLPNGYGNMVIQEDVRNSSTDTKMTKTSYSSQSGDMGCTIITTSPVKEISKSVLNGKGYETETYNTNGTADEIYVDNDGCVQRTISYGKVSSDNVKYQVTGITREVIDLSGKTKQVISDDEYNANLDALNFGVSKLLYVKNKNEDWAGTRYKTSYSMYGPFSVKLEEELDAYGTVNKTYFSPEGWELKSISDSGVEDITKYDKTGRITEKWQNSKKQKSYSYSSMPKGEVYAGNQLSAKTLQKIEESTYRGDENSVSKTVVITDFDGKTIKKTTTANNKTNEFSYVYNAKGTLVEACKTSWAGTSEQEKSSTYYYYDSRDRLIKEETPLEKAGSVTYMSKTETSYYEDDSVKEVKTVDSAKGKEETCQSTYYEYDNDGRVILERSGSTGNYNYVQYIYDSLGNTCIQITGLNTNAVIKSGITDVNLRDITFDPVASCNDTDYAITRKIYDGTTGQLRREVADDGSVTEYQTYDDFDQPLRIKSPNKNITEYTYDDQGRCINKTITTPGGSQTIETTDYYDIGKVINGVANITYKEVNTIKEGANSPVITTKIFDGNTRLKEETTGASKKEYEYDTEGKRTKFKVTYNNVLRMTLNYAYNSLGLLETVRNQNSTVLESYDYYANGNLQSKVNPIVTTNYTYNLQGMITKLSSKKTGSNEIFYEENLDRNLNGQINKSSETVGNIITDYTYDRMGRISKVSDNLGKVDQYSYDDYNNIKEKSVKEQSSNKETKNGYFYNKTKWTGFSQTVYISGSYSSMPIMGSAEYDENGNNTLDRLNARSYSYNANNQMASQAVIGSTSYNDYSYDAQGLLYTSQSKSTKYGYVWDEDQLTIITLKDSQIYFTYARGNGVIGAINESGTMSNYFVSNYRGDVVKILDASGNILKTNRFDEFGEDISSRPNGTGLGYAGEYCDLDSATVFLRARSYSPANGRFLQKDRFEDEEESPASRNLYLYCNNDSVNSVMPKGTGVSVKNNLSEDAEEIDEQGIISYASLPDTAFKGAELNAAKKKKLKRILFVHLVEPVTIRTTTKKIQGITYPKAKVVMRCQEKYIKTTITSRIGIFTFKKLNLKKYKGKKLKFTASKKGYKNKNGYSKKIK